MQGQVDAAREYMEENDLRDDDLKESMLSGSPPKQSLASKRRASRSDQRDVGDVDDDDFENPNRALSPGRGGRGSFNAGIAKGRRDQNPFSLDEELKEQDEDTGSAGQALDSTSGMNKAPKDRVDTAANNAYDHTSQYNQAGQAARHSGDDSYTADDTTSSGGYGVNAGGDSFSPRNQSGIGGNAPGQFK